MSYVKPGEYREFVNRIGVQYAAIRDAIAGQSTEASLIAEEIVGLDDEPASANAPAGSIANDLGTASFQFGNLFSSSMAKSAASSYFSSVISKINSHVVKRSGSGTLASYFAANNSAGSDDAVLFMGNNDANYYFSEDFVELCTALGVNLVNSTTQLYTDTGTGNSIIVDKV